MAPLIVLAIASVVLRLLGAFGVVRFRAAREVVACALAIMFFFTATAHFTPMKYELAAMVPPPLTGQVWIIYLTGVLEAVGAIGLISARYRRAAALGLIALLVVLLPANIFAALYQVPLRGRPPTPLAFRIPLQLFWMGLLWWSSIRREPISTFTTEAHSS